MSRIFDALQRSESERAGGEESALPEATELLRRAERLVVSQWETEVPRERLRVTETAHDETTLGMPVPLPAPFSPAFVEVKKFSSVNQDQDAFGLFQSLSALPTPDSRLVCITASTSPAAEAFRLLGVRLRHLRRDRPLKKVLITSTIPKEGKSMTAANLACTLAVKKQQKVLLLEGDVRRPTLSTMFGIGKNAGLCECLQGSRSLLASIYHVEGPELWILPAGNCPDNPLELLQSGKLAALMDQLSGWFDWIVIDSPPVLPVADTSIWMRVADGILLVTRQGTTEMRQLKRGLEAIEPQKMIGVVMNGSKHSTPSDYYYLPDKVQANRPEK